ncbi:MAG: lysophospholipid acyltransferase family protein [Pseudomonadota bacterium]|nr:lysophospholipid acyltransferase family protein [Pseudomonadota bacterium]
MSKQYQGRRLWLVVRLLAWLPLPLVTAFGAGIAILITLVPLRYASAFRVVLINLLATHPDMSLSDARRIGRQSMAELGRTLTEFSHVWHRPVEETLSRVTHIHGEQAFLEATASERPVLLLSLHQGSWEISNLYLGDKTDPEKTLIMYQPHPATLMDAMVKAARERTGSVLIPTNSQGVKQALAAMKAGGTLGILSDHNPGNRSNPCVPFFGYDVPTPALIDKLVQRYRPHVFIVSCHRGKDGVKDIHIHFEPAPAIEQASDCTEILTEMNAGLQRCIDRNLAQYQWTYKRFKWGPHGRRRWYRQSRDLLARIQRGEDRRALGLHPETDRDQ